MWRLKLEIIAESKPNNHSKTKDRVESRKHRPLLFVYGMKVRCGHGNEVSRCRAGPSPSNHLSLGLLYHPVIYTILLLLGSCIQSSNNKLTMLWIWSRSLMGIHFHLEWTIRKVLVSDLDLGCHWRWVGSTLRNIMILPLMAVSWMGYLRAKLLSPLKHRSNMVDVDWLFIMLKTIANLLSPDNQPVFSWSHAFGF